MNDKDSIEKDQMTVMLSASVDRLSAAAVLLEKTIVLMEQRRPSPGPPVTGEVQRVVAAVETPVELLTRRETELERRLEEAENQIVELRAQAARGAVPVQIPVQTRKTIPAIATNLLAKQGLHSVESIDAGALDAALTGLSLEQRIAVKSQLLRSGVLA